MFQPNPELVSEPATQDTPVAALLRRAKALIAREEDWCQGYLRNGAARCLIQAIRDATGSDNWFHVPEYYHALKALAPTEREVSVFNDTFPHVDVMGALSRAIEAANAR
jgi:hypothetical protein